MPVHERGTHAVYRLTLPRSIRLGLSPSCIAFFTATETPRGISADGIEQGARWSGSAEPLTRQNSAATVSEKMPSAAAYASCTAMPAQALEFLAREAPIHGGSGVHGNSSTRITSA